MDGGVGWWENGNPIPLLCEGDPPLQVSLEWAVKADVMVGAPRNTQQLDNAAEEGPTWPHHIAGMLKEANERLKLSPLTCLPARPACQSGENAVQFVSRQAQATCLGIYLNAEECDPGCRTFGHAQLGACVEYGVQILATLVRPRWAQYNEIIEIVVNR